MMKFCFRELPVVAALMTVPIGLDISFAQYTTPSQERSSAPQGTAPKPQAKKAQPKAQQSKAQQSKAQQSKAQQSKTQQSKTQQPVAQKAADVKPADQPSVTPRNATSPAQMLAQPEQYPAGTFALTAQQLQEALKVPKNGVKTNQFTVEYVEPTEPRHILIHDMMKDKKLLEKFQAFLAPIRLPNPVKLQIAGCDGRANAHFWQGTITVCYEYFEYIWGHTPKMAKAGLSPRDAMIGPTVDVFLHEAGHAILQQLDIPLLAREEDAADYIATYLILEFCDEDARRLILGASFISGNEAMQEQGKAPQLAALADVHSLPAVRYFNRWCMAYGKNPALFADAIDLGMLTPARAKHCSYEYAYISDAMKRLIEPFVDQKMAQEIKSRKWFTFETPFAEVMARPGGSQLAPEATPSAKR